MIFYFSGTGNSKWVAELISTHLNDRLIAIGDAFTEKRFSYELADGEALGFVFPTYSWGPAPIVVDFMKHMEIKGYYDNTFVYMVTTCGDDVGLTVELWQEALGEIKGCAAYSVQMPNTYILLPGFDVDDKDIEKQKKHNAEMQMENIIHRLKHHHHAVDVVKGSWAWVKSRVIYPWFRRYSMTDKKFVVDSKKCTHCGTCVNKCPMKNITLRKNETPKWHGNCAMCLGCIHRCPERAIDYGRTTQKKGRYHFDK